MIASVLTAAHEGIEGVLVRVEAAKQNALPAIHITGLPGDMVRESRERVRVCLEGLGYRIPSERIVVHLSPAYSRKQGSHLDLAIALSVLGAEEKLKGKIAVERLGCLGELGLDGRIHGTRGSIALLEALARSSKTEFVVIPSDLASEAALLQSPKFLLAASLSEVLDFIRGERALKSCPTETFSVGTRAVGKLDQIEGHALAKRALAIATAGRHHLLLIGSPGVGKTLLANAMRGLLPPLDREEAIQVMKNRGGRASSTPLERPFRSPHHTTSSVAIVGGGSGVLLAGEVTQAHLGILFLDEFPEFRRDVIEGLREPLETGVVHVHRLGVSHEMPARFLMIAAMNPCPCGQVLNPSRRCSCTPEKVRSYRKRVSGAILDRIDLGLVLNSISTGESPREADLREQVCRARDRQRRRWGGAVSGDVAVTPGEQAFALDKSGSDWLDSASRRGELSHRGVHKLIRVARTVADLEGADTIHVGHLREAWSFRCPDLSLLGN